MRVLAGSLVFAGLLLAQSGWVALPIPDYNALRAKARPADPEAPPADFALSRVEYALKLDREARASGRVTLTADVFRDGETRVPLPSGLVLSRANLPPDCRLDEGFAIFTRKGSYKTGFDVTLPVTSSGAEQRIVVPGGAPGVLRVSLEPVRPGTEMMVAGGSLADSANGAWIAYGTGTAGLALTWRRRSDEPREVLPLKQSGSVIQLWTLGEDSSSFTAEVSLDVAQGSSKQLAFSIAGPLTVNQVLGGNVADWSVQDSTLTVAFLEPVDKGTRFVIQGESKLAREGELKLPLLRAIGLDREQGGVAAELTGPAEIRSAAPVGMEAAEASRIGGQVAARQSPSLSAFRYLPGAAARSLTVQVARYAAQALLTANVEEARFEALFAEDGKLLVRARYAVRNNQRNFLKVTLPPDAQLWSASLGGRAVRPGQASGALMFPLSKPAAGEDAQAVLAEITYLTKTPEWGPRGRAALTLPKLDLPVSRSGAVVYWSGKFRAAAEPGAFRAGSFAAPDSPAFRGGGETVSRAPMSALYQNQAAAQNSQILVDQFRAGRESRQPVRTPGGAGFPAFGPSLFLTAELTAENQEPRIELSYQLERKGEGK